MTDTALKTTIKTLLDELERIGEVHGEICDTMVREMLFDAVYAGFFKPREGFVLGDRFGLYEPEGNAEVREALARFISAAPSQAADLGLNTPNERLRAFYAPGILSEQGLSIDEFFGWLDDIE